MTYKNYGFDMKAAFDEMQRRGKLQFLHNELRNDFGALYKITAQKISSGDKPKELMRACLKELFSLIEADLFLLNNVSPYDNYMEFDKLTKRFKKTYKKHCEEHQCSDLYNDFIEKNWTAFENLKIKRDHLTHPKGVESIDIDEQIFEQTHLFFKNYVGFVSTIMQGVGVEFKLPANFLNR